MTLTPIDDAKRLNTPPLQGRGRGWGLSAERLDVLKKRAREMRNNPTEPEKRLWRHLSNGQLCDFKFRRQAVIGNYIADFLCPRAKLVVEVDGDTHEQVSDEIRDAALAAFGFRVLHFANAEVMENMEGILTAISRALGVSETPHPNPSPEGEGLDAADGYKPSRMAHERTAG